MLIHYKETVFAVRTIKFTNTVKGHIISKRNVNIIFIAAKTGLNQILGLYLKLVKLS